MVGYIFSSEEDAKILMLHGNGQSQDFFERKTQFLQDAIHEMLLDQRSENTSSSELRNVQFVYPSGILPANPDHSFDEEPGSMRSWGYGDPRYDQIVGIERAVHHVLAVMETQGPFVGIVGFSSGSAVAAIVTSLLEKRKSICGFRLNSTHPRLKFAAFFSGFQLEHPRYRSIYSTQIETPTLHVIGTLDAMILPSQSLRLVASCDRPEEFHFFGAHYVPRSKALIETFKAFVKGHLIDDDTDAEDNWEDFDDLPNSCITVLTKTMDCAHWV